jgi:hypothetical protein
VASAGVKLPCQLVLNNTDNRPRENLCVWIDALVRCRGNVYYQVDYGAAIGGRYDAPGIYADTHRLKTSSI